MYVIDPVLIFRVHIYFLVIKRTIRYLRSITVYKGPFKTTIVTFIKGSKKGIVKSSNKVEADED